MATHEQVTQDMLKVIDGVSSHFIALVCSRDDCKISTVVPRYPGDVPGSAYMTLLCPKHEEEGDIPAYFDNDGNELSQDERTWCKHLNLIEGYCPDCQTQVNEMPPVSPAPQAEKGADI